ncbi:hypothetical protein CRE_13561 [Caenorhabditis remanei]|uniref:Fucosyltransferase n=1 Tax=Caenorhabditis remanei TaxID=31234 RepID=E3N186_CAERE|nr:hypothetical protein CRE_13561 [Caenorhabditis remanei]
MSYDGDESRLNDYLNLTGKIVVYAATPFFGSPITNSYLKNCPESVKGVKSTKLQATARDPYKFTIAFENSNCKDYVTEKFWRKAGRYKVVPIVMERKIYKNLGIPDDMYIAIDDYPNLTDFVEHIQKISENETEYIKYHKWRENYRIVDTNEDNYGFCQLCQKLGKQMTKKKKKSYENLAAWHSTLNCDNSFANRYLK